MLKMASLKVGTRTGIVFYNFLFEFVELTLDEIFPNTYFRYYVKTFLNINNDCKASVHLLGFP